MDPDRDILITEARITLGSLRLALTWLYSPCECLDQQIPAEVAKSRDGYREVLDILYRIRGTIVHRPSPDSAWHSLRGGQTDARPDLQRKCR